MLRIQKWKEKIFSPKKNTWGISFDQKYVRFFSCFKNEASIENIILGSQKIPESLIEQEDIIFSPELPQILRRLKENYQIGNKPVVTVINTEDLVTRYLELPLMSDKDLKNAILWEAEQYLPYSREEAVIDYQVLGSASNSSEEKVAVFVAAVSYERALNIYNIFKNAGLNLNAIDIIANALKRWFLYFDGDFNAFLKENNVCVINIEEFISNIIIFKEGNPIFSKIVPIDFTKNIKTLFVAQELVEEIKFSLEAQQNILSLPVSKFILTGSLSDTPEISTVFLENFKIPVEVGHIHLSDQNKIPASLAVTAGLSLRDL